MLGSTVGQEHSEAQIADAGLDGVTAERVEDAMREDGFLPPTTVQDIRTCLGLRLTWAEFYAISSALRETYQHSLFPAADYHYPMEAALAGICREWLESRKAKKAAEAER